MLIVVSKLTPVSPPFGHFLPLALRHIQVKQGLQATAVQQLVSMYVCTWRHFAVVPNKWRTRGSAVRRQTLRKAN